MNIDPDAIFSDVRDDAAGRDASLRRSSISSIRTSFRSRSVQNRALQSFDKLQSMSRRLRSHPSCGTSCDLEWSACRYRGDAMSSNVTLRKSSCRRFRYSRMTPRRPSGTPANERVSFRELRHPRSNVMIYWATSTIDSSFMLYYDFMNSGAAPWTVEGIRQKMGWSDVPPGVRDLPERYFATSARVGGAVFQRSTLDGDAARRSFCSDGR